jgi:hypothetical protein
MSASCCHDCHEDDPQRGNPALRYRAMAALAKGSTMAIFGLWVLAITGWHAWHGTLPHAFTMGAVGFTALAANAASFALLWGHRGATPICVRRGFARGMMFLGILPCC